jgi:NAD(P)-dependent dehydrogenase (short-subunit alcohol dehydrogenase family)
MIGAGLRLRRRRRFDYADKVIVVTGGAGGIGSAFARRAAVGGASLVIVDLDEVRGRLLVADLAAGGSPADHLFLRADLTDPEQIAAVLERISDRFGRIDVLVNNTGMTSTERFGDRSLASMGRELLVNTLSPLYVTRLALPLLRRSADPRVITTVSLAGIFPQAETPIYCASKFALRGAMLSIAIDLRSEGIKIGSVLPSATDTRMLHMEAITGGNLLQFQDPPQAPSVVAATMTSLLDRPRLEAYPKPRESYLVRAVMAVPNSLFFLLPFFEGKGVKGHQNYLAKLIERGDVIDVDGRLELAQSDATKESAANRYSGGALN